MDYMAGSELSERFSGSQFNLTTNGNHSENLTPTPKQICTEFLVVQKSGLQSCKKKEHEEGILHTSVAEPVFFLRALQWYAIICMLHW